MQICQSLIGGQLVASALPAIDKIYPATGETIAKIEPPPLLICWMTR